MPLKAAALAKKVASMPLGDAGGAPEVARMLLQATPLPFEATASRHPTLSMPFEASNAGEKSRIVAGR
ncbi:hypothetical protein [Dokdonella sp.]|uniref:hypothetical protein n=1 Tax=Dokdonella sp. TaxID=2291710 RepID=UPI003782DE02